MNELYNITNPLVSSEDIKDHTGVGMVVHHKNDPKRIAIFFHNKYQFWTIPVGKVKTNDNVFDGAKIELFEELSINATNIKMLGMFSKTYDRGSNVKTAIDSYLFDVIDFSGVPINIEPIKHPVFVWKTIEELESFKPEELSDLTRFYIYLQKGIYNVPSAKLIK